MNEKSYVHLTIDGNLTPLSFAKSIIESNLLKGGDFRELVDYLTVHVRHHCYREEE